MTDDTRHDTTRHDTTRHDTTRHDTTRHGTTRHDTTRHTWHNTAHGTYGLGDGLGNDDGAEALGLLAHVVGEIDAADALGEAREVLDVGSGGQLAARGHAARHPALVHHRLQVGPRRIDRRRVTRRAYEIMITDYYSK
jgi:hypothetical protein